MKWNYCPNCAGPLHLLPKGGAPRPTCAACGFIHFADPKVTVCVLITQGNKVLLGRRDMDPQRGKWCTPGGFMDYGEPMREAAAREAREETGLTVEVGALLMVSDWDDPLSGKQGIALHFAAAVLAGEPRADDDLNALAWFPADALPEMAFPSDVAAIGAYLAGLELS